MSKFRGIILDIDGTLIDSNDAHTHAWLDALAEEGINVLFEKVRPLIGMGGDKVLPKVSGIEIDSAQGKRLSERRSEIFEENYLSQIKPFPKVRDLIMTLQERGVKIQIGTSAQEKEVDAFLKVAGVPEIADRTTTSDDAEESKPDPDIVSVAIKKIKLDPSELVMLGDTPYDLEAATRAGVKTIIFRCGGWWKDADFKGAFAIYDGPAELLEHLDEYFQDDTTKGGKQMADNNEQKKDFTELDPDQINLKMHGEPAEGLPESGDPSQSGKWSGKPPVNDASAKLPEVQPDNMPGDTEVITRTIYQRN